MPSQMQAHGVAHGLPFVAHGAMWSDATLFAATMATIMTLYAKQWKAWHWASALTFGLLISACMHWGVYVNGQLPGVHVRDGMVTSAGMIHFVYMAAGLAVVALFYLFTEKPNAVMVKWVSAVLILHTVIGNHVPLKIWAKFANPAWYPVDHIVDAPAAGTILGTVLTLCAASMWALR